MNDNLHDDWREFLSLMISKRVKFLLLGGHAVSVHAHPRVTEDLDVFVEVSALNARRLRDVLIDFGFGESAPTIDELATEGKRASGRAKDLADLVALQARATRGK